MLIMTGTSVVVAHAVAHDEATPGTVTPGTANPGTATTSPTPTPSNAEADRHCGQHLWNDWIGGQDPSALTPAPTTVVYLGGTDDGTRAFGNGKMEAICLWSRSDISDGGGTFFDPRPNPIGDPVDLLGRYSGTLTVGGASVAARSLAFGPAPTGASRVDIRISDGSTAKAVLAGGYYWAYGPAFKVRQVTAYYADSATAMWAISGSPPAADSCTSRATDVLAQIQGARPGLPALVFTGPDGLEVFGDTQTLVACSGNTGRVWTRLTGPDSPTAFTAHLQDPELPDNWVVGHAPVGTTAVHVQLSDGTAVTADLRAGYYLARWPDKANTAVGFAATTKPVVSTSVIADTPTLSYTWRDGVVTTTPSVAH
jgi:hypothetical protein